MPQIEQTGLITDTETLGRLVMLMNGIGTLGLETMLKTQRGKGGPITQSELTTLIFSKSYPQWVNWWVNLSSIDPEK